MRQTLIYDQGKKMACHRKLAQARGVKVCFGNPHNPWQRGSCENTNGLLRQFPPKGTALSIHHHEALDSNAGLINNRPRQTLGWKSPNNSCWPSLSARTLPFTESQPLVLRFGVETNI